MTEYCSRIRAHYQAVWNVNAESVSFDKGPISDLGDDFAILKFKPHSKRKMWTYATQCMSQPNDHSPLELHIFSLSETDDLAELMVAMAHYHRTGKLLGLHDTVNFGRPWMAQSLCHHGLISLPYLDGPSLEWLELTDSKVRFLWVVPICEAEREFARSNGIEALEDQFEKSRFDYADPYRQSVV